MKNRKQRDAALRLKGKQRIADHRAWIARKGFMTEREFVRRATVLIREAAKEAGVTLRPRITTTVRWPYGAKGNWRKDPKLKPVCDATVAGKFNREMARQSFGLLGSCSYQIASGVRWEVVLIALKARLKRGVTFWEPTR